MQPTGCRRESADRSRRRYGWLRMVFSGARLFRAPICRPSGGGDTREAGSTVAESMLALDRVGTHQGRRALRSSTSQGSLNPCARELKARTRRFLREKLISDHGMSSSYEGRQGAANGQDSWHRLHQLKASTTMDPGISIFPMYILV